MIQTKTIAVVVMAIVIGTIGTLAVGGMVDTHSHTALAKLVKPPKQNCEAHHGALESGPNPVCLS